MCVRVRVYFQQQRRVVNMWWTSRRTACQLPGLQLSCSATCSHTSTFFFFFFGLSHTLQDTVTSLSPIQLYVHSIECTHTLKGRVLDCHPDCNLHAHKHTQWHVSSTQEDLTKSTQASKKHTVEFTLVGRVMARVWLSGRRTVVTKVDAIIGGMTD